MKLLKQAIYVLVLLLVVALVWVSFSVYNQSINVSINPNASNYTRPIKPTFNTEEIGKITERIEENFSVSPSEFFLLVGEED
jgi:hypothetical protein